MQKEWIITKNDDKQKSLIERLLAIRGITKSSDIQEFLNPLSIKLSEPDCFCDMKKAVERIETAINEKQKIVIYGDFDADGITSTSILFKILKHLDADVDYYIPDRENEGHGMNTKTLVKIMTSIKPKVLITVDCGISNYDETVFLNSFHVDVIITDHHEAPENLPPAYAIINPKAPNSLDEKLSAKKIHELTSLAGCGVSFKLGHALLNKYKKAEFLLEVLPLVTVGTIADLVPLIGENRYFAAKGLELISKGQHYGLKRLLESAGYNLEDITSETIAFGVAPRINATGRLDNVEIAMKLLLSENKTEIEMAVQTLNELNKIRQNLCEETFLEADEMLQKEGNKNNAIILFKNDWNVGIIGIVASKFVEKYYKPTFIINYHSESNTYRCSARGIKGLNIFDILDVNSDLFLGFGGHEMAGGFSFSAETISLENLKNILNKTIDEMLGDRVLKPFLNIDLELEEKDLTLELIQEISKLEPFGMSNEQPVFSVKNLVLKEKMLMGENKNHLRLKVQGESGLYTCIWWSKGDLPIISGDKLDIAFCPKINTFRDVTSLQLIIEDIHNENLDKNNVENSNETKVFDHRNKTEILPLVEDYVKTSKMNILVFAENQTVINGLKPFKSIYEKIINRQTLKKADSIMFFDYPPTENDFDEIIKKVAPKHIHYMQCADLDFDDSEIIKNVSGMVKYVCNNKDGIFELKKSACYLALTVDCIKSLLEVFQLCGFINILDKKEDIYRLEFVHSIEFSNVLKNVQYKNFKENLEDILEFKNYLYSKQI